eukprot:TRINITY_DN114_c0_g1_i1.p1 TRINITY_DN114_c0_g1~~TRINITY_DN114_c0_g1_i1.p1  ORF type:complete len:638 (+),score=58.20 TRINITY_DN114_c0_g1_i1:34-1947(+)
MISLGMLLSLSATALASSKFGYVPGMGVIDYQEKELVDVRVNSLHSHEGVVSYDYYSLKFCKPLDMQRSVELADERLGEILWGDRIFPSLYELRMLENVTCKPLNCPSGQKKISLADLQRFETRINNGYRGNFVIDNLPVVAKNFESKYLLGDCQALSPRGYALGVPKRCTPDQKFAYINNHLKFEIKVNMHKPGLYIVVSVNIIPYSIRGSELVCGTRDFNPAANEYEPLTTNPELTSSIGWTYSVEWTKTDEIGWSNRWDAYLSLSFSNNNARVHWKAILNSLLIILILGASVARMIQVALRHDIDRYNDDIEDARDEIGWKLVHGDVFRNPSHPAYLSIVLGNGVQLIAMMSCTLFFAMMGFLSPSNRGALISATVLFFVLMSLLNGVVTGFYLRNWNTRRWLYVFISGTAYPGLTFGTWLFTEAVKLITRKGANTAPIISIAMLMGLWICVSLPLVVLGASFGFKYEVESTQHVNQFERKIPPRHWLLSRSVLMIAPGILPFGAAFIELRFILSSMWQGMVYYVFGFLTITALIVIITAAEVSIVMVYFLLVNEDHKWQWPSVYIPGGMAIHFFLYSIYYAQTSLTLRTWLGTLIFFQTMSLVSLSIWISVGTVGYLSCALFTRTIYGQLKVD